MLYEQIKKAAENFIEAINKERIAQGYKALSAGEDDLVFNAYLAGVEKGRKIKELLNPWISVEERLPEEKAKVLVRYIDEESEVVWYRNNKFVCIIPDQQKYIGKAKVLIEGSLVEKPIYSVPQREVVTDIVTHWMPIPELNHDDMIINGLKEMNEHFKKGE